MASKISKELNDLKEETSFWSKLGENLDYLLKLSEEDLSLSQEEAREVIDRFKIVRQRLFLSGKYDKGSALVNIYAGAGGDDAQDWAMILLRMYQRYAEKKGFSMSLIAESKGDQNGLKSATLEIRGRYIYGFLKKESGVHRLVRISPFSAKQLRHTSFALVDILPEVSKQEVSINDDDIKIETFRSSGPGGQNMQKTESAVRITHLPTGITAEVQSERSQGQNKERALSIISARLFKLMEEHHLKEISELKAKIGPGGIEWGSQIRSYVLHPYKSVKDHRTGEESTNPESVLDGNLDNFIEAELIHD